MKPKTTKTKTNIYINFHQKKQAKKTELAGR